ncbi:uncharacterized protein LOC102699987 [Oryza brachyantha]|uniref:Uncharacterized protein n=1 Tax=Oryza brachyantha TaxID=4533 RepID=J3MXC1_ORYBR|nr:uncharacterized protein LOC102699987 [Oryza brachyantha]
MDSAAVKVAAAALCVLVAVSVAAGQLKTPASTSTCPDVDVDVYDGAATPLLLSQPRELELIKEDDEARLAEELALLVADGAGATICPTSCQKCLVKCAASCVVDIIHPPTFVACFLKCAVVHSTCFAKK